MKLGPSAVLRAIRKCLWPKVDNRNNTTRPLVSLGCSLDTDFTSGIIAILKRGIRFLSVITMCNIVVTL